MLRLRCLLIPAFIILMTSLLVSQSSVVQRYDADAQRIVKEALGSNTSIDNLTDLCSKVGNRISGSPQAAQAVAWAKEKMEAYGFDNVHLEPVMVPHWVRGPIEEGYLLLPSGERERLKITTLGGSIGTPPEGITAEVVEVKSFEELQRLGDKAKGKIIFYNRPMDRTLVNTFAAYGGAVDQRGGGAIMAARAGGVAALVPLDDHTTRQFPAYRRYGVHGQRKERPGRRDQHFGCRTSQQAARAGRSRPDSVEALGADAP